MRIHAGGTQALERELAELIRQRNEAFAAEEGV